MPSVDKRYRLIEMEENMNSENAIEIRNMSKSFKIQYDKANALKNRLVMKRNNIGGQWGTIIDVEGTRRLHILRIDHGRLLGQCLYWNQHDHQVYEK